MVLEALSCGLPVVAYNTKGPKEILEDSKTGFLVESGEEMAGKVVGYFLDPGLWPVMRKAAFHRAGDYNAGQIMDRLLSDLGLRSDTTERCVQ